MAYTVSNMMPLGTKAPDFNLLDTVSGERMSLTYIQSDKATVIVFSCNHCPFVHFVNDEMVRIAKEYQAKGVAFAAISSNDVIHYPQDKPERMTAFAKKSGYTFPYLYDETQEIAKNYKAQCTPEFYLFNQNNILIYRGRMDDSSPKHGRISGIPEAERVGRTVSEATRQ